MPLAYYATFFSIRADEFDSEVMIFGKSKVREKMAEIKRAGNDATAKDKNMYAILELVLEMYERGFNFLPIDLYKSDAIKFKVEDRSNKTTTKQYCRNGTNCSTRYTRCKKESENLYQNKISKKELKLEMQQLHFLKNLAVWKE